MHSNLQTKTADVFQKQKSGRKKKIPASCHKTLAQRAGPWAMSVPSLVYPALNKAVWNSFLKGLFMARTLFMGGRVFAHFPLGTVFQTTGIVPSLALSETQLTILDFFSF